MNPSRGSEIFQDLKRQKFDEILEQVLREEQNKGASTSKISACAQLYYKLTETETKDKPDDIRLSKMEDLLKNKTVKRTASDFENFPKISQLEFHGCAGKYESCRSNEITETQLQRLRRPTEPTATTSLRQSSIGAFLKPQREPPPAGNFLKPQRDPPTVENFFKPPATVANFLKQREPPPVQEVKPIEHAEDKPYCGFRTAREELMVQNMKKYGHTGLPPPEPSTNSNSSYNPTAGKRLGLRRTVVTTPKQSEEPPPPPKDPRLAHIDQKMVELIESEIMRKQEPVSWDDIAGLDYAKSVIEEIVIASLLRPDLYKGLRRPPRGVLLFGPPGTGKTLIGRCIASQSKSTFFSISASSITSKYVGESEKMVRALFAVATVHQPAVIFIDEIDSMLCKRNEGEQEFTRRLKNEFLVQLDGTTTSEDDRIVVVGATNRPQELDEAARRRLVRRLYIPLPDLNARIQMITNLLTKVKHNLAEDEINEAANLTDGYSCADLKSLLHEAALKPLRGIPYTELMSCTEDRVRPVTKADIRASLRTVRPTVAKADLAPYLEWNKLYGTVCEHSTEHDEDYEDA